LNDSLNIIPISVSDSEEIVLSEKENKNAKCIAVELDEGFLEYIDHLVNDAMQFKSRDDFIKLACHELVVRRTGAVPIPV